MNSATSMAEGRIETLPMTAPPAVPIVPVVSQISDSSVLNLISATLEHILATLARFDIRITEQERRSATNPVPTRPLPDPPYGMPYGWQSETAVPKYTPSTTMTVSQSQTWQNSGPSADMGTPNLLPPPGFVSTGFPGGDRANSAGSLGFPRTYGGPTPMFTKPQAAWAPQPPNHQPVYIQPDIRPSHHSSSWDHPDARPHYEANNFDQTRHIRMDPPRFDGSDATSCIARVQYYFDHIMLPKEHRLHYVVMLFDPPATEWVFNYRANNTFALWPDFLEDVRRRFDPKYFVNYVGLIAKLHQTGTIAAYNTEFESMSMRIKGIPESTLLPIYLEGLQQPVRNQVKFQHPSSIAAAMALAVEFDSAIDRHHIQSSFGRRNWQPRDTRQPGGTTTTTAATPSQASGRQMTNTSRNSDFSRLPVVRLSAAEKSERNKKGLCWYCPEQWVPGHVCKRNFLAYMGMEEESNEDSQNGEDQQQDEVISADLSHIYALEGRHKPDSLELRGNIGKSPITILVDTGSSHDFLHPRIAKALNLPLQAIRPFRVYVGNGESLVCSFASIDTELIIQGLVFHVKLHILPVHGPDVILGMAWLLSLHRVTNDYDEGTIEFHRDGVPICLHVEDCGPREISLRSFASIMTHRAAELFEIVPIPNEPEIIAESPCFPADLPAAIVRVLEHHRAVFQIPSGMPPIRPYDHRVHLVPNAKPVNVRPYRYPYFQKNEIERQVKEMMENGFIQQSNSPFSSPVLLIRKKDGSFRFCIDYRALNAVTVPDHFPIPTTDELFDELGAARCFTKLDLRSGYHQIRMNVNDIYKTAFRTHDGHFEFLVMPFGLTNAPSTFQAAMNDIFRPLLRKSVIVFFDDILVYSSTVEEHSKHLAEVLTILQNNQFFVKISKCTFCCSTVDYLGHLISDGNLKADESKITAMVMWPTPSTVKQLRGFLGLTGYYRRFIAGYAMIAAPLTELLKKDAFKWSPEAEDSFAALKAAMTSAPVLRLPNFSKTFVVETDASDFGIGAVLLQENHPIAFFSKKLGPRRRITSTYHKELYAIVEAVQKWRQYLLGREFVIRSDQKSLKELLQQVIQTPDQQLYARKLMGYKFRIEYKTGASNRVADALSRRDMDDEDGRPEAALLAAVAQPVPEVLEVLRDDARSKPELLELIAAINDGTATGDLAVFDGLVYKGRRIFVCSNSAAKEALMYEYHSTPTAGHPGVDRTFRRIASSFYWKNMRKEIKQYVEACFDCQTTKYSTQKPAGLLQPLPIPTQVWDDVSMDFITRLRQSKGYTTILVAVDRLTKYAHFAPLPPRFDASRVANLFVDTVVKHHGFPKTLVSDRDPLFLNEVWENMLRLSGTKLCFTTAYHPQSDGQTEVRNRGLEQYLRAFVADRPAKWTNFLPWAELALNCFHHEGLGTSPFHALYGREPPQLIAPPPSATTPPNVADIIRQRGDLIVSLRKNLEKAQQRMRSSANRHRREVEFAVDDKVLLKLQPYIARPLSTKLARRFYGPFDVVERIGPVAYRLELPPGSRIHDVFHVSLLKPFIEGTTARESEFPEAMVHGKPVSKPTAVLRRRRVWRDGTAVEDGLLSWGDDEGRNPTWEPIAMIEKKFPSLLLEDKEISNGGRVDTCTLPVGSVERENEQVQQDGGIVEEQRQVPEEQPLVFETRSEEGIVQPTSVACGRPRRQTRPPDKFGDYVSR